MACCSLCAYNGLTKSKWVPNRTRYFSLVLVGSTKWTAVESGTTCFYGVICGFTAILKPVRHVRFRRVYQDKPGLMQICASPNLQPDFYNTLERFKTQILRFATQNTAHSQHTLWRFGSQGVAKELLELFGVFPRIDLWCCFFIRILWIPVITVNTDVDYVERRLLTGPGKAQR
jgi:hypothetical protein